MINTNRLQLHERPDEGILLLGEMHGQVKLIDAELKRLPFRKVDDYRSSLRIIAGACATIRQSCEELLDDPPPPARRRGGIRSNSVLKGQK